jgi:hypothetical protein
MIRFSSTKTTDVQTNFIIQDFTLVGVFKTFLRTTNSKGEFNIFTIRIGGSRSGLPDSPSLLACKAVSLGEFFSMFKDMNLLTVKTKALSSFETSGTTCPVLCHTPEDWNLRTYSGWMKPSMTSSS